MDCTLAAFAIALDKTTDELIALVGHEGREVVHPHLPTPLCYRGYHIQEWVDCCARLGKALVLIEREPVSTPNGTDLCRVQLHALGNDARFASHLARSRGVICGQMPSGVGHSLAWIAPNVVDGLGRQTLLHQHPMTLMYFAKILDYVVDPL